MALYNNGYPATYQQYYPQFQPNSPVLQQNNVQNQQNGLIWIQGEQAAKSYLVAPNNSVVLFDSESQSIYIKSADASGMPSMKVLDYTIRDFNRNTANSVLDGKNDTLLTYATKSEFDALKSEITALREKVNGLTKGAKDDE